MTEKLNTYYNLLDQWLKYYGYESIPVNAEAGINVDKVSTKSQFKASKFGKVDSYACIKYMGEGATGDEMKIFSTKMFELANRHRTGMPLGFGAMMVVYPLMVVETISNELAAFIRTYVPKHFAAAEFPAVYDLSTGYLYFYEGTPVWGYAYYNGYRREVFDLFSPKAWEEVAKK